MPAIRPHLVLALAALLMAGRALPVRAQMGEIPKAQDLVTIKAAPVRLAPGARGAARVVVMVRAGWHVQANPAANENSIPTTIAASGDAGLSMGAPEYPPGRRVKLPIDDQPLSVYDGMFAIEVPVSAAASAPAGAHTIAGKLRFQACNDQICLPPATKDFQVAVEVSGNGSSSNGSAGSPGASPGAGLVTSAPPAGSGASSGGAIQSPLAGVLLAGGWLAFLTLFLIGLGLNLTPCVYPMLSVTVSIFGARRAASPAQAVGAAVLYVLGMATMYSALGVIAALTGSLFGGWLSNPIVTIGIGLLLVALSFSMFGLYQLNLPPAVLARLGGSGATSALQIFASGLVVGVIAAPCVGPPVVALLAVVGQKADPWFGFRAFFTLAMGLGAPYLVLATFSNLLQKLPRSGEWMIWVEKVFGVVLFGVGLNYILLALAPAFASWVLPAALIVAGVWLGFAYRRVRRPAFRWFQRLAGGVAILAGVMLLSLAPRARVTFEPLAAENAATPVTGQLTLIDFSADWCQPCHELDNLTFTDGRVMRALGDFKRLRVDLTRYDSPEAEAWRKRYEIGGVPTLVFALADGREVRGARVEGFLTPKELLEKIDLVRSAAGADPTSRSSTPR